MCHVSCIVFGARNLAKEELTGKTVVEVGSRDVNGSLRPLIESWPISEYVGIDLEKGPGVDILCGAEDLVERFGRETWDVIICTELLEHVMDWRRVISNIKNACKPGGIILMTTRGYGYPYHGSPLDFWRFDLNDMKNIFSDCKILVLEEDYQMPGVFIKVKKPQGFIETDLSRYEVYSIVVKRRVVETSDNELRQFYRRMVLKTRLRRWIFGPAYRMAGFLELLLRS